MIYIIFIAHKSTSTTNVPLVFFFLTNKTFKSLQSESGATESGSISTYTNDSEIEMEIKQDPQQITVPITVCISIMIGYGDDDLSKVHSSYATRIVDLTIILLPGQYFLNILLTQSIPFSHNCFPFAHKCFQPSLP